MGIMTGKVLLIGGIGAGKTSLKQLFSQEVLTYRKTQMLEFSSLFIDCPGEYLAIPRYYHVLIDASHQVKEIWALQDSTQACSIYPPNFAKIFGKPVVGIITKIDLPQANIEKSKVFLNYAGIIDPVYQISVLNGEGSSALKFRLQALV